VLTFLKYHHYPIPLERERERERGRDNPTSFVKSRMDLPGISFMLAEDKVLNVGNVSRMCFKCATVFQESENFGVWACKQHSGELKNGTWNCCGSSARAHGCVPCDHTSSSSNYAIKDDVEYQPFMTKCKDVAKVFYQKKVYVSRFKRS